MATKTGNRTRPNAKNFAKRAGGGQNFEGGPRRPDSGPVTQAADTGTDAEKHPTMTAAAAAVWAKYRPAFELDDADLPIFEIWCESFAAWRSLLKKSEGDSEIVLVNGQPVPNPLLVRADREVTTIQERHRGRMNIKCHDGQNLRH